MVNTQSWDRLVPPGRDRGESSKMTDGLGYGLMVIAE